MMPSSFATPADLRARLESGLSEDDEPRAQALLDDVSTVIRDFVDPLTWVDEDGNFEDLPDTVFQICLAVAKRSWTNPDGLTGESVGAYSWQASGDSSGLEIGFTQAEEKRLRRLCDNRSGFWSQPLGRDPESLVDAGLNGIEEVIQVNNGEPIYVERR